MERAGSKLLASWRVVAWFATAVFVGLGGSLVLAHGGDSATIHGCVDPTIAADGRPNVIIVGPNDSCPAGFNPTDWAIQGPKGETGADGQAGAAGPAGADGATPAALSPDPLTFVEVATVGGLRLGKQVKVVKKSASKPPFLYMPTARAVTSPHCPATHPKRVTGGYETEGVSPAAPFVVTFNGPFPKTLFQWSVSAIAGGDQFWTLTAYQVCTKK